FVAETGNLCPQVVAHEIELMFAIALSGMAGEFRGRRGKDQPSTAGIDGGKAKHVPEKGPVGLDVACVDDGMHACNHGHLHRCGSVVCSLANCGHCANRICFDANSLNSGSGLIGPDPTLTEVTCSRRPNTWLHRPARRLEVFPGQLGAVHTWHKADLARWRPTCPLLRRSGNGATAVGVSTGRWRPQTDIKGGEKPPRSGGRVGTSSLSLKTPQPGGERPSTTDHQKSSTTPAAPRPC